MRSTTSKTFPLTGQDPHLGIEGTEANDMTQRQPILEAEDWHEAPVRGLEVLIKMVSHVEKPESLADEKAALAAVRAIFEESKLSGKGEALRQELDRLVQCVQKHEAQALIQWIQQPATGRQLLYPKERSRPRRLMLLFLLLAKTVGKVYDYQLLGLVRDMAPQTWAERLDKGLCWMPRYLGDSTYIDLADAYLEATRLILFENMLLDEVGLDATEFSRWPWTRQILHLRGWRRTWDRHASTNPSHHGSRLEFQLARRGAFGRLAWRGGRIARRALRELQYADLPRPDIGWPRRSLAWLFVLVLLTAGSWWGVNRVATNLRHANKAIIEEIESINPGGRHE